MKKMSSIIKYCDDLEYFNGNLYLDSFQENIYGALSVIGMKKDFNPEEDQIIVSSQNADIPKEDMAIKLDADFILITEEIKELLEELTSGLGDKEDG